MDELNADAFSRLWSNQVNLFWSRIQTASAIEAGTLGGAYSLWKSQHPIFVLLLLVLAIWLLVLVWLMMTRDIDYQDAFRKLAKIDLVPGLPKGRWVGYISVWTLIIVNGFLFLCVLMSGCLSN